LEFSAFGHRWTLFLGATLWSRAVDLFIGLWPKKALEKKEALRLQKAGFPADLSALFRGWGFNRIVLSSGGSMSCHRKVSRPSEIARSQQILESLDVSATPGIPTRPRTGPRFDEFLRWMRRSRSVGWRTGSVEFRKSNQQRACGVRWRVRYDLAIGPTHGWSWFFAWPPRDFKKADWRRVERTGFFQRSTEELTKLGYKGHWRPGLFSDPDRLAAEFWKPTDEPAGSRKDFNALLRWRPR
jgi:hypothetical protein